MNAGKKGVISGINITPLTDIFLVLLIIMMLLPIIEMKELQLSLKQTTNVANEDNKNAKTFEMRVEPDRFVVEKSDTQSDGLIAALRAANEKNPDGLVIKVSEMSRHEQLAQALAAAKDAGIKKVAVERIAPAEAKGDSAAPPAPAPAAPKKS